MKPNNKRKRWIQFSSGFLLLLAIALGAGSITAQDFPPDPQPRYRPVAAELRRF